jgi:hypothetical protein
MKTIILTALVLAGLVSLGMAQSCDQFINSTNGKKLVYSNLDAKGNEQGKAIYLSVKKDASTVAVHSDVMDKNGKPTGSGDFDITCNGGSINIDMRSFVPQNSNKAFNNMEMQVDAKYIAYPLDLSAGEKLPDGSVIIIMNRNGSKFGEIHMDITNRNVEQKETITTAAGNFDCFKISYDALVENKIMGISIPINMKTTEWFSPNLGRSVKSETYNKNGKLMATTVLESIN